MGILRAAKRTVGDGPRAVIQLLQRCNPRGGWAQVLTEVGMGGPYTVVSIATYEDTLQTAARAIAETGRPVGGLVMWSGRHAWVMSGFESIGDPAQFPEFQVTGGVHVLDPLYPYGSGQWGGPSPEPNSLLSPEQLATQFVSGSRVAGALTCPRVTFWSSQSPRPDLPKPVRPPHAGTAGLHRSRFV